MSHAQALENYNNVVDNKRWYNSHPMLHISVMLIIIMPLMFLVVYDESHLVVKYFPWLMAVLALVFLDFLIFCVIIDGHRRKQLRKALYALVDTAVFDETAKNPVNLWTNDYHASFEFGAMQFEFRADTMKYRLKGQKHEFETVKEALIYANRLNNLFIGEAC